MPFGVVELGLVLVLVLVFFGPGKRPKAGEAISRIISELRRAANGAPPEPANGLEGEPNESAQR